MTLMVQVVYRMLNPNLINQLLGQLLMRTLKHIPLETVG